MKWVKMPWLKEYLLSCLKIYKQLPDATLLPGPGLRAGRQYNKGKEYLEIAKGSYRSGYRMNEDQLYYVNYPHQIKLYEIEQALSAP